MCWFNVANTLMHHVTDVFYCLPCSLCLSVTRGRFHRQSEVRKLNGKTRSPLYFADDSSLYVLVLIRSIAWSAQHLTAAEKKDLIFLKKKPDFNFPVVVWSHVRVISFHSFSVLDEVSRVLPSLVLVDRASPHPKVAAHVTGSFVPKLEREGGGESCRNSLWCLDSTSKSDLWFKMYLWSYWLMISRLNTI